MLLKRVHGNFDNDSAVYTVFIRFVEKIVRIFLFFFPSKTVLLKVVKTSLSNLAAQLALLSTCTLLTFHCAAMLDCLWVLLAYRKQCRNCCCSKAVCCDSPAIDVEFKHGNLFGFADH